MPGFGEAYYNVTHDLKLTGGLRWTDDQKHFVDIPSELLVTGYGYPITGIVNQAWEEFTGRLAANWTPKLDFTDQTLSTHPMRMATRRAAPIRRARTCLTFRCTAISQTPSTR